MKILVAYFSASGIAELESAWVRLKSSANAIHKKNKSKCGRFARFAQAKNKRIR